MVCPGIRPRDDVAFFHACTVSFGGRDTHEFVAQLERNAYFRAGLPVWRIEG